MWWYPMLYKHQHYSCVTGWISFHFLGFVYLDLAFRLVFTFLSLMFLQSTRLLLKGPIWKEVTEFVRSSFVAAKWLS